MHRLTKNDLRYNLSKNDILYFHHIPKTAGTSFIFILENYFNYDSILKAQTWHQLSKNLPENFTNFHLVKGHFGYAVHQLFEKKPIYITMLRNPTEVIISYLRMIKSQPVNCEKWNFSKNNTISDLILRQDIPGISNPLCLWLDFDLDVSSLTKGLEPKLLAEFYPESQPGFTLPGTSDEEILETAKQHLLECKFFGIVERFQDSLLLLNYTFGWKPYRRSTKLNISQTKENNQLTSEAKEELDRKTKLDSQLYDFANQLFEKRFSEMINCLKKNYYEKKYGNMNTSDMIYEMLEKDYQRHFLETRSPVSSIDYTFDQKIEGTGWHEREMNPITKKIFRWSGPENISTIDFALLENKDIKIQFNVIDCITPNILDNIQFDVNESSCKLNFSPNESNNGGKFEASVPKSVLENHGNLCRLSIKVTNSFSPNSLNPESTDTRKLGIAIDSIKIS